MIRFGLVLIFLFFFFIVSLLLFVLLFFVGLFNKNLRDRISYVIVSWAFRVILVISGTKIDVIGRENIPMDKAALYVGNHRSIFDMNCLFLDRENIKEGLKMIIAGTELLKSGISVFIFPEGTRTHHDEDMIEFKEGSLKMAEKSGAIIVPVAINTSSACF